MQALWSINLKISGTCNNICSPHGGVCGTAGTVLFQLMGQSKVFSMFLLILDEPLPQTRSFHRGWQKCERVRETEGAHHASDGIWVLPRFTGQSMWTTVGWSPLCPQRELQQRHTAKGMWWFCYRRKWRSGTVNSNPVRAVSRSLKPVLFHFQELKLIGLDIPHFAADLPLNRCKNRYTNILPCKMVLTLLMSFKG